MSDSQQQQQAPTYEAVQLKDGSGWFVRVTYSDGHEVQINDFADEPEARAWIATNGPHWHEWASHRVQPRR
jgi:hypothetical protein